MVMKLSIRNKPDLFALVDDEDFPVLSRYSWTSGGQGDFPYIMTNMQMNNGKRCVIYLHKLIMAGFGVCDHINGNQYDNRKENLRRATMQENGWNSRKRGITCNGKPPTSKYKGVSRIKGEWRVQIKTTKKGVKPAQFVRLGPFKTEIEAAKRYNEIIVKLRGEWAWLNPIPDEPSNKLGDKDA